MDQDAEANSLLKRLDSQRNNANADDNLIADLARINHMRPNSRIRATMMFSSRLMHISKSIDSAVKGGAPILNPGEFIKLHEAIDRERIAKWTRNSFRKGAEAKAVYETTQTLQALQRLVQFEWVAAPASRRKVSPTILEIRAEVLRRSASVLREALIEFSALLQRTEFGPDVRENIGGSLISDILRLSERIVRDIEEGIIDIPVLNLNRRAVRDLKKFLANAVIAGVTALAGAAGANILSSGEPPPKSLGPPAGYEQLLQYADALDEATAAVNDLSLDRSAIPDEDVDFGLV
ncbi:hypothetical protein [Caulobacter ginsengisoli]|nr:hypothetical protein [Caulobacter ginsengisoli]